MVIKPSQGNDLDCGLSGLTWFDLGKSKTLFFRYFCKKNKLKSLKIFFFKKKDLGFDQVDQVAGVPVKLVRSYQVNPHLIYF